MLTLNIEEAKKLTTYAMKIASLGGANMAKKKATKKAAKKVTKKVTKKVAKKKATKKAAKK